MGVGEPLKPYTAMLELSARYANYYWYDNGNYHVTKATDAIGKKHKKKWKAHRHRDGLVIYFSRLEQAARWVVLDA